MLLLVINCTNSRGQGDPKYEQHIGNTPCDEKDRAFMRRYLAVRIYFGLLRIPDFKCLWSTDPLKTMPEFQKLYPTINMQ